MLKGKLLIALASAVLFLGACSNNAEQPQTPETPATTETTTPEVTETPKVEEGYTGALTYERLYDESGEKADIVSIVMEFENSKPVSVEIDVLVDGTDSKKALAESGEYVMSTEEGALQWHEQIKELETFLTENNFDTTAINITDDAGHTDTLTGVSMKVGTYVQYVQDFIDRVSNGETEFNFVSNETAENVKTVEFKNEETTDVIEITYVDGKPAGLKIDNIQADGTSKREAAENGTYDMGGELNWAEQVDALAAFIVENDFNLDAVNLTDEDGHTDAVSGVSIKVGQYLPLIEEALAK